MTFYFNSFSESLFSSLAILSDDALPIAIHGSFMPYYFNLLYR